MSNWPDKPPIRITAGLLHGRVPLRGALAEGLAEPVLTIAHYALAQMARSLGGEGL